MHSLNAPEIPIRYRRGNWLKWVCKTTRTTWRFLKQNSLWNANDWRWIYCTLSRIWLKHHRVLRNDIWGFYQHLLIHWSDFIMNVRRTWLELFNITCHSSKYIILWVLDLKNVRRVNTKKNKKDIFISFINYNDPERFWGQLSYLVTRFFK